MIEQRLIYAILVALAMFFVLVLFDKPLESQQLFKEILIALISGVLGYITGNNHEN
jgi:hypothetical protein